MARLYHERWEVEAVFDELKTHLGHQARRTLRSKTPERVRQEFLGWVMAHYAVRWLMHGATTQHRASVRDLSLVESLQIMGRTQPLSGDFPLARPRQRECWFRQVLTAVAPARPHSSRGIATPRMIKRRHSPYASYDKNKPTSRKIDDRIEILVK